MERIFGRKQIILELVSDKEVSSAADYVPVSGTQQRTGSIASDASCIAALCPDFRLQGLAARRPLGVKAPLANVASTSALLP